MSESHDEKAENERRTTANLLAVIVVLLLIIAGYWLIRYFQQKLKLEECLESGRRDCVPVYVRNSAAPP